MEKSFTHELISASRRNLKELGKVAIDQIPGMNAQKLWVRLENDRVEAIKQRQIDEKPAKDYIRLCETERAIRVEELKERMIYPSLPLQAEPAPRSPRSIEQFNHMDGSRS